MGFTVTSGSTFAVGAIALGAALSGIPGVSCLLADRCESDHAPHTHLERYEPRPPTPPPVVDVRTLGVPSSFGIAGA
jgi:hypothetical protein